MSGALIETGVDPVIVCPIWSAIWWAEESCVHSQVGRPIIQNLCFLLDADAT